MKGAIVVGWMIGLLFLPIQLRQAWLTESCVCYCVLLKTLSSVAVQCLLLFFTQLLVDGTFYYLLRQSRAAKADFSIHTISHSLDARFDLVETIKTTENVLPIGSFSFIVLTSYLI